MINSNSETIVLGGGCFWCLEAVFSGIKGVISATSGYAGGNITNPTYEQVCSQNTNHAEVVKIEYNPNIVSLETLLNVFFKMHDPTTKDRQGADIGSQYRSIILYTNEKQKEVSEQVIKKIEKESSFKYPIVTEIKPLQDFYKAEEYHQKYFEKNPNKSYCQIVIAPKIKKLEKEL